MSILLLVIGNFCFVVQLPFFEDNICDLSSIQSFKFRMCFQYFDSLWNSKFAKFSYTCVDTRNLYTDFGIGKSKSMSIVLSKAAKSTSRICIYILRFEDTVDFEFTILYVIKARVVAVGYNRMALCLECFKVVLNAASKITFILP